MSTPSWKMNDAYQVIEVFEQEEDVSCAGSQTELGAGCARPSRTFCRYAQT